MQILTAHQMKQKRLRKSPDKDKFDEAKPDRKSSISAEEGQKPNDKETICKEETKNEITKDRKDTIEAGLSILFEKVDTDKMIE